MKLFSSSAWRSEFLESADLEVGTVKIFGLLFHCFRELIGRTKPINDALGQLMVAVAVRTSQWRINQILIRRSIFASRVLRAKIVHTRQAATSDGALLHRGLSNEDSQRPTTAARTDVNTPAVARENAPKYARLHRQPAWRRTYDFALFLDRSLARRCYDISINQWSHYLTWHLSRPFPEQHFIDARVLTKLIQLSSLHVFLC